MPDSYPFLIPKCGRQCMQLGPGLASSWGGCGGKGSCKLAVSAAEAAHGAGTHGPSHRPWRALPRDSHCTGCWVWHPASYHFLERPQAGNAPQSTPGQRCDLHRKILLLHARGQGSPLPPHTAPKPLCTSPAHLEAVNIQDRLEGLLSVPGPLPTTTDPRHTEHGSQREVCKHQK